MNKRVFYVQGTHFFQSYLVMTGRGWRATKKIESNKDLASNKSLGEPMFKENIV